MNVTICGKIGEGVFADVWRGTDEIGRDVAVKIIRGGSSHSVGALAHARALAVVSHENIVAVYSVEQIPDPEDAGSTVDCVLMEYVAGETLGERFGGARFTLDEARSVGLCVINGVQHIHARGIAHGDLHAENIMVAGGAAKILDILYLASGGLSTDSLQNRTRRDIASLRLILQDIISHSVLENGAATLFNNLAGQASGLRELADAFQSVANPGSATDTPRQLDAAFNRIVDEAFVDGEVYGGALAEETPRQVVVPLLEQVIERSVFQEKHSAYMAALFRALDSYERERVLRRLAEVLEQVTPVGNWSPHLRILRVFGPVGWYGLPVTARIRLESVITNDILAGRVDIYRQGYQPSGALGSHANWFAPYFLNRDALIGNLDAMLRQSWYTQNYIGSYFMRLLPRLAQTAEQRATLVEAVARAVLNDARILKSKLIELPDDWLAEIEEINADP